MGLTDLIVIVAIVAFTVQGWRKGLARTLAGPLAFLISIGGAAFYYKKTGNLLGTLSITFLGPLVLGLIFSLLLFFRYKNKKSRNQMSQSSRITGGFFAAAWGGAWVLLLLFFLMILPAYFPVLQKIKTGIEHSASYRLARNFIPQEHRSLPSWDENLKTLADPSRLQAIQSSPEFHDLQQHPKIQVLLTDQEILTQIEQQEFARLLTNPKIQALLKDEELIKKFWELNRRIMETETTEERTNRSSAPKVYEFNEGNLTETKP